MSSQAGQSSTYEASEAIDVVVVGASMGGICALHRLRSQGLTVQGVEGASDLGAVWFHNRYPGTRVDIESIHYCYFFSADIYRDWEWAEGFAAQPEILSYPLLAERAERLTIFQRSPNCAVPARNRPINRAIYDDFRSRVREVREELLPASAVTT